MNRALGACAAAGSLAGMLVLTACGSGPSSPKASDPSCAPQVAAWSGTGVLPDLANLPGQLNITSADVSKETGASTSRTADTSAVKGDLALLTNDVQFLASHQPPSCVSHLRADYATFLRFYGNVGQDLQVLATDPGQPGIGPRASGHVTQTEQALAQVRQDLSGYPG